MPMCYGIGIKEYISLLNPQPKWSNLRQNLGQEEIVLINVVYPEKVPVRMSN